MKIKLTTTLSFSIEIESTDTPGVAAVKLADKYTQNPDLLFDDLDTAGESETGQVFVKVTGEAA